MGRYFNPPTAEAIESVGARPVLIRRHPEMVGQLQPGERLGLFLDRFRFHQVADVTEPAEYAEFMEIVGDGCARVVGIYAMPEASFNG